MNTPAKPEHVVILCHPGPDSFNAAVAAHYCAAVEPEGQSAVLRDLYAMDFDPVLRIADFPAETGSTPDPVIARERALIADAAVVVLVYPIWLGSPPAMLKGYIERVFGTDFALHADHHWHPTSQLAGKHLLSFSSSGNSRIWLDEQGQWQSLIHAFDGYLHRTFGMASDDHVHFPSIVNGMNERFFQQNMEDVRQAASKACRIVTATP
jgi:NAD(P)H dehydrogenase (quinone)